MKYFYLILFLALSSNLASAAITITITPNGAGGTTFLFSQTSPSPNFSVSDVADGVLYIELPPSIFGPSVIPSYNPFLPITTIQVLNPILATFIDASSGFTYDVGSLVIRNDLSNAAFGFNSPFSAAEGQTEGRLDLVGGLVVDAGPTPAGLVLGTRTISSRLFGTVTVNVIPEPTSVFLVLLSSVLLARRHRHPETAARNEEAEQAVDGNPH